MPALPIRTMIYTLLDQHAKKKPTPGARAKHPINREHAMQGTGRLFLAEVLLWKTLRACSYRTWR